MKQTLPCGRRPAVPGFRWLRLLALLCLGGLLLPALQAQNRSADRLAFEAASRDFNSQQWDRAVREFSEFEAKFAKSPLRGEAGQLRLFAQAEATAAHGDLGAAGDLFAQFQRSFPGSSQAGHAALRESAIRLKLGDAKAAVVVLAATNSPFARVVTEGKDAELIFGGLLLKAEALVAAKELAAAEVALIQASGSARSPRDEWERLRLLLAVQDAAGRLTEAADTAQKLKAVAEKNAALAGRRAEAFALAGRLWLRQGDTNRAITEFQANVAPGTPADFMREATFSLADAFLSRGELARARDRLETFVAAQPADVELNRARLLLGQTQFRQYQEAVAAKQTAAAPTLLALAATQYQSALTNQPAAELLGPLLLARGWTLWEEGLTGGIPDRVREAGSNFLAAVTALPHGGDQAVARFKAADCQFQLGYVASSLTNYLAVLDGYADVPAAAELVEPAASQAVLAATQSGNREAAERAMTRLLAVNPGGAAAARGTLLLGQSLARTGEVGKARETLTGFLAKFPETVLKPEVELMLGTVELRARNWTNALAALGSWLKANPNHPQVPRAEFDRAWASAQAGLTTNATAEFAALAARFPTNTLAPTAQLWLADNYFRQGDYTGAEKACLALVTNTAWTGSEAWHRARFWAAEAARKRQSFGSASQQLLAILNDKGTPTNWVVAAYFALGELRLEQPAEDPARPLGNVSLALEAFTAVAQLTNAPQAAPALGKMADCHLQLAALNTNSYARAAELYQRALEFPGADLAVRCKAAVGLGIVQEKLAQRAGADAMPLWEAALNRYLDVAHGKLCRPGEVMDPWWVKEAGRNAGQVLELTGRWREAALLYDWLAGELPAQQAAWRARATQARQQTGG
jgi:TolA-binding protein